MRYDVPVVLVGLDTIQGLQAARIYARAGVDVVGVISDPGYYASKTRVCREILPIGDADVVDVLLTVGDRFEGAFLLPCHDKYVAAVAARQDELRAHYRLALPPQEVVETLMAKTDFARYAQEIGMSIPRSWVVEEEPDLDRVVEEASFPVAVKPSIRTSHWMSVVGEKAVKVEDADALRSFHRRHAADAGGLIVQDWIEGGDGELYSCNGYFRDGEPLATFTARKIRQWPPRAGQSSLGVAVECPEVRDETLLLARSTRYTGLLYVETKRDTRTGRHFVIEPNVGRPTGRSAIAEAGGVALLMTAYCDTVGAPLPDGREQRDRTVKWVHLLRDLRSSWFYFRHGELSLLEWARSMRGRKAYAVFSLRDPMPFLHALAEVFRGGQDG